MPNNWTAEAVYELVRTWPREAWPEGVKWQSAVKFIHRGCFLDDDEYHIRAHHAASLFVASGQCYLIDTDRNPTWTRIPNGDDGWVVSLYVTDMPHKAVFIDGIARLEGHRFIELTELECISAAILAGKEEEA